MLMVAFLTLMIVILGIYSQIFAKQTAVVFNQQSGAAQAMMVWHMTAVDQASNFLNASTNIPAATASPYACQLSSAAGSNGILTSAIPTGVTLSNPCIYGANATYVWTNAAPAGSYACNGNGSGQGTPPCWSALPPDYNATTYPFYSIAFSVGTSPVAYYVLTYVPPVNASGLYSGFLCLPGSTTGVACANPLALSYHAFYRQVVRGMQTMPFGYGTVSASGTLTTPAISIGTSTPASYTYTIPGTPDIPVGSIGLITQILPCKTC